MSLKNNIHKERIMLTEKEIREREERIARCYPPIPDFEIMEKQRRTDKVLWFAMTFLGGVAMAFIIVILLIDLKTL
jgi:hypothetical protein